MSESAHDRLAQLRHALAEQRAREDKLRRELAQAQNARHVAVTNMKEAYAEEDPGAQQRQRAVVAEAEDDLAELSAQVAGAELRVQRAEEVVAGFQRERAADLLREREDTTKQNTAALGRRRHRGAGGATSSD